MNTISNLVCDPRGKPILFERLGDADHCIALVDEHLHHKLTHERLDNNCHGMIPDPEFNQRVLSIPERASVATLAWHCREYGKGLKRGESITMPVINAAEDIESAFVDEGRAYMFAQVVETVFEHDAQVVSNSLGWTVVVGHPDIPIDGETVSQLRGACRVLMDYPIGGYDDAFGGNIPHEIYPAPAAREAWYTRKNAQVQRIEDGINAILAHLGHPAAHDDVADSVTAGAELIANIEALARDKRATGAVKAAGKKSSAKRSA